MILRYRVVVASLIGALLAVPTPALACSREAPPTVDQLLDRLVLADQIRGFYEIRITDASPLSALRPGSTTVVVRHWGIPPDDLGVVVHRGELTLAVSSCGNTAAGTGDSSYFAYTTTSDLARPTHLGALDLALDGPGPGLSTREIELLDERFGPSSTIPVAVAHRIEATVRLWIVPVTFGLVLLWLSWHILRRLWRWRQPPETTG